MKLTDLLEELIYFTGSTKLDVAAELGLSSSSLSKILSGKRSFSDASFVEFRHLAAHYFSRVIFDRKLQGSLDAIFPVILRFETPEDLYAFLKDALTYCYRHSAQASPLDADRLNGVTLANKTKIMHYLCLKLSTLLRHPEPQVYNVYCTFWLPFLFGDYRADSMSIRNPHGHKIILHQIVQPHAVAWRGFLPFLKQLEAHLKFCDFRMYVYDGQIMQHYIFAPSDVLILCNPLSALYPLVSFVEDKVYLKANEKVYLTYFNHCVSLDHDDYMEKFVQMDNGDFENLLQKLKFCVSFFPLGLALEKEELIDYIGDPELTEKYIAMTQRLSLNSPNFCIANSANDMVLSTGEIYLPTIGTYQLSEEQRRAYLKKTSEFWEHQQLPMRVMFQSMALRYSFIMVFESEILIYTKAYGMNGEKLHRLPLPKEQIAGIIADELSSKPIVEYDPATFD